MSILNNVRDAFTRVVEAGAGAAYLIRDAIFGAPPTVPSAGEPYTPPFNGGQCSGEYKLQIGVRYQSGQILGYYSNPNGTGSIQSDAFVLANGTAFTGPINSIEFAPQTAGSLIWRLSVNGVATGIIAGNDGGNFVAGFEVVSLLRSNGQPDNCGNLPNPNPGPPISDNGLADSAPPDILGDGLTISEGLAPLPAAGALAAALAALRSALELAALAEALADALQALKDLLKNKDDKDDKKNVRVIQLDLGLIQRDGFLRLYPSGDSQKYQALYLDLQVRDIPRSFGRFFGQNSPNYYRFNELGYIAWVSPTFGVIAVDSIRFSRVSLGCPDGAIGFFYHLGLNGIIKANATAFYEEEQEDESQ